jgi:hypothetical protein
MITTIEELLNMQRRRLDCVASHPLRTGNPWRLGLTTVTPLEPRDAAPSHVDDARLVPWVYASPRFAQIGRPQPQEPSRDWGRFDVSWPSPRLRSSSVTYVSWCNRLTVVEHTTCGSWRVVKDRPFAEAAGASLLLGSSAISRAKRSTRQVATPDCVPRCRGWHQATGYLLVLNPRKAASNPSAITASSTGLASLSWVFRRMFVSRGL